MTDEFICTTCKKIIPVDSNYFLLHPAKLVCIPVCKSCLPVGAKNFIEVTRLH